MKMKNVKQHLGLLILVVMCVLLLGACKDFLDIDPPETEVVSKVVFENNTSATSAVLSIYGEFMRSSTAINTSVLLAQAADEMVSVANPPQVNYYTNNLSAKDNNDFWTIHYQTIYRANSVLEGLSNSTAIQGQLKSQLQGEALFVRAFFHFYLVNLFGDVPYITTTNYKENNLAPRMPAGNVYQQILTDFKLSKALLTDKFPNAANVPGNERVRPNRGAAHAMLARTYLFMGDWQNAILEADSVINNTANYELLGDLNAVFKMNSKETVWAMMPSAVSQTNTFEGSVFILSQPPSFLRPLSVSPELMKAFEAGDKRRTNWVGTFMTYNYPHKYKVAIANGLPASEYSMVIRLAELYLIRAEAYARLNQVANAVADINRLRSRARDAAFAGALPAYSPAISQSECLDAVAKERYVELFTEWGHRWLDLKRSGRADAVLKPLKGSNWQTTDQLLPIPESQLINSPAYRGAQNPGY